jgi:opacity protein-like surface antigen
MRKSLCIPALLAIFAFAVPAKAQEEPSKADLYVGYDYLRVNSGGTAFNFNGGSGQLGYNVNHWLEVVGEFGGYYTGTGFRAGILSYLFGPRINFRPHGKLTPFAHGLFGGGRTIVDSPQNAFAMSAGGGVDFKVSEHFAVRPIQAEYFRTNFTDGARNHQNDFRQYSQARNDDAPRTIPSDTIAPPIKSHTSEVEAGPTRMPAPSRTHRTLTTIQV